MNLKCSKMNFEKATVDDVPLLHILIETCYRGDIARKGWTCEDDILGGNRTTEEYLREEITTPGGCYLKCTNDDGQIVGCVYTKLIPEEKMVYFGTLCVYPTLQSQGLGKKLLAAAENIAKEARCTKLCMTVLTVRKELIAWYEKMGFKFTEEVMPFPGKTGIPKIPLELGTWEKVLE